MTITENKSSMNMPRLFSIAIAESSISINNVPMINDMHLPLCRPYEAKETMNWVYNCVCAS
ncbi:hypothetical protein P5G61_25960 [Paenibacillus sp. F6_3S_P_1C]|uniref:Uncharacterized protein n=1 Tax=Paenibacillus vandeheii TaxID=3035917 RepID=A0ABT8JI00_9BACL|nr:hypothetical protein [Paenibacillus vandeheii]